MAPGILYISYDGMLEPLGQSQVLAYLERLAADYRIHLISFEKREDLWRAETRISVAERIARSGINWHPLRYHRTPTVPATGWDIFAGTAAALYLARRHDLSIVHARSYVAAVMALAVKRLLGAKFLFDMRGFWADERVDGGLWPAGGRLVKGAKATERRLLQAADHVITLTHASAAEIASFAYLGDAAPAITVIPTCADLNRFSPRPAHQDGFTFGYLGSAGTWYQFDETLACFRLISERLDSARMLIVNRGEHEYIEAKLAASGIARDQVELIAAEHAQVPDLIARMSVGAAVIKPAYSKIASAPTKLAEYLGCGVPCLGNIGVGDVEDILEGERVGVALRGFSNEDLTDGVSRLLALTREEGLRERCVSVAHKLFSLDGGVAAYDGVYRRLLGGV